MHFSLFYCQAATCADVRPVSKLGVKFVCPEDREYDPTKSNNTSPTVNSCCSQVRMPCSSPHRKMHTARQFMLGLGLRPPLSALAAELDSC